MLFNAATILGFVAVATAAPHLHSRFEHDHAARGVSYNPLKSRQLFSNFGNSFSAFGVSVSQASIDAIIAVEQIQILQLQQNILDQIALEQEILLTQAIQLQLQQQAELNLALDNIRINTFNNLNNQVNTVAVLVTQVIDSRDVLNVNSRYLVRQIQSNPSISEQAFVVIQETATMTISNNIPSSVFAAAQASSSASAFIAPSIGSYTPGADIQLQQSGINLLPLGVQVPSFANAAVFSDPALIVLPNQAAFVQSVSNQALFQITSIEIQQSQVISGFSAFSFDNQAQQDALAAQILSQIL